LDDRKNKEMRDERERIAREARAAKVSAGLRQPHTPAPADDDEEEATPGTQMPGTGQRLNAVTYDKVATNESDDDDDDD
jgi:hypothetical protein